MKSTFESIKKRLKENNRVFVACHIDPDGDAIGSMLALGIALERKGLVPYLFCVDGVPKIYQFLPGAEKIKKEIPSQIKFDLAFVIDSSALCRVGEKVSVRQMAPVIINIDHHPDNAMFGDINCVKKTSSVAEMIYELCRYLKIRIDVPIANCLYAAMITDTGNFRYDNTSIRTFAIAADLLKAGVKTHELTTKIYDNKPLASIRITAGALAALRLSPNGKIAWTVVTDKMMEEVGAEGEDLTGIVDRLRSIGGVEVAVFFREKKEEMKINFRSKEKINVSEIARRFGGGGHYKAAGAVVNGRKEEVVPKVIKEVEKYLEAAKFIV